MRWISCYITACVLASAPILLVVEAKPSGGHSHGHRAAPPHGSGGNHRVFRSEPPPVAHHARKKTTPVVKDNKKGKSAPVVKDDKKGKKPVIKDNKKSVVKDGKGSSLGNGSGTGSKKESFGSSGKSIKNGKPAVVNGSRGKTAWSFKHHSPGKPKKMTSKHRGIVRDLAKSPAVTKPEAAALGKVLGGQPLTSQERTTLSALALNQRDGVTQADREAVSRALDDDLERNGVSLSRRYLYLRNDTGGPLTVSVLYYTLDSQRKNWLWLPGEPPSTQTVKVTLQPGATRPVKHKAESVLANRARVWATNPRGADWSEWKDEDLWLVPEKDEEGYHRYYATSYDTFTFRFQKK